MAGVGEAGFGGVPPPEHFSTAHLVQVRRRPFAEKQRVARLTSEEGNALVGCVGITTTVLLQLMEEGLSEWARAWIYMYCRYPIKTGEL